MSDPRRIPTSRHATAPARLPAIAVPDRLDDGVLTAIRAIAEHLEVMRGRRGNAWEAVVTQRDLQELGLDKAVIMNGSANGTVLVGGRGGFRPVDFDAFAESIRNTKLYRDLLRRLDDADRFNDLPEKVKALLLPALSKIAAERHADIVRTDHKLQTANESFAAQVTEVTAAVQGSLAGVRETLYAHADENRATAGRITQVEARVSTAEGDIAAVETSMTAVADRATGLEAQYTLKLNAGGAIAGIGLAATDPIDSEATSAIYLLANKFAFIQPTEVVGTDVNATSPPATRIPFGIDSDGTVYVSGTMRVGSGGPTLASTKKTLELTTTSHVFQVAKSGTASPTSVTLTANAVGLAGSPTFTVTSGTATLTGTGTTRTLTYANLSTDTATIQVSQDGLTDTVTIAKVREGADALNGFLTNEAHTVPADSSGNVTSWTGAGGNFKVYLGSTDVTSGCTFSTVSDPDALTDSITSAGAYSVTGAGSWAASSTTTTITYRATYNGATLDKVFTLTKSKAGTNGTNGSNGSPGSDGTRGSMYAAVSGSYSSGSATSSAFTSATGRSDKVIGDTVEFLDSTSGNSRYYRSDNFDGWIPANLYVNGNMIVSGTISGSRISGGVIGGSSFLTSSATATTARIAIHNQLAGNGFAHHIMGYDNGNVLRFDVDVIAGTMDLTAVDATRQAVRFNNNSSTKATLTLTNNYNANTGLALETFGNGYINGNFTVNNNLVVNGSLSGSFTISGSNVSGAVASATTATNLSGGTITGTTGSMSGNWTVSGVMYAGHSSGDSQMDSRSPSGRHAVRGYYAGGVSGGLVGAANGYDFYADQGGTNYGPFTGTHDALLPAGTAAQVGQIVVDVQVVERNGISSTICEVALSSAANQKGAIGVVARDPHPLSDWVPTAFSNGLAEDGSTIPKDSYAAVCDAYAHVPVNAVGEGQLLVCGENGPLEVGDLIVTSSLPGIGMKQADDIVRSYTVAKVREAVTFSSATEVKTVACIYLCG